MQIHNLKRNTKRKTSMDVGRGGKRGKTSGRGTKGQSARAGAKFRPAMRDTIKKLPKLRGYKNKSHVAKSVAINLDMLNAYESGNTVSPKTLVEKGILNMTLGKMKVVKILGNGEITFPLNFERVFVSDSAKNKIIAAGGTVTENDKNRVDDTIVK